MPIGRSITIRSTRAREAIKRSKRTGELETLKAAIKQTVGDRKDVTVLLRADANTPHHSVVRAMDAAAQLGLVRISIATVESK